MSKYRRYLFFFFSSRRRHTRLQGDWSSDVCSSDLAIINQVNTAGNGWNLASGIGDLISVKALDWLPEKRTAMQNLNLFSDWLSARREIGRASCRERV